MLQFSNMLDFTDLSNLSSLSKWSIQRLLKYWIPVMSNEPKLCEQCDSVLFQGLITGSSTPDLQQPALKLEA